MNSFLVAVILTESRYDDIIKKADHHKNLCSMNCPWNSNTEMFVARKLCKEPFLGCVFLYFVQCGSPEWMYVHVMYLHIYKGSVRSCCTDTAL